MLLSFYCLARATKCKNQPQRQVSFFVLIPILSNIITSLFILNIPFLIIKKKSLAYCTKIIKL